MFRYSFLAFQPFSFFSFQFIFFFSFFFLFLNSDVKGAESKDSDCPSLLLVDQDELVQDHVVSTMMEEYSIKALLMASEENLAVQHPSIVMSAPQYNLSIIEAAGYQDKRLRQEGSVRVYSLFSGGLDLVQRKQMAGLEPQIDEFIERIRANANGSPKVPTAIGPHGTGKSEFLEILRRGVLAASSNNPDAYFYTFYWKNLPKDLSEMSGIALPSFTGGRFESDIVEGPFTLLPETMQNKLLSLVQEHRGKDFSFEAFSPERELTPKNKDIYTALMSYYQSKQGRVLNEKEFVEVLDKHVVIKRHILGTFGTMPLIDVKGQDYDHANYFLGPHLVNYHILGPSSSFAWVSGAVFKANRSAMLLDEIGRYKEDLQDLLLGLFESRVLSPWTKSTYSIGHSYSCSYELSQFRANERERGSFD